MSATDDLVKLSYFSGIGKAITMASTLRETLDQVMQQIGAIFAPTYWSLLLKVPTTGDLRFTVVIGSGVEALRGRILPKGTGVAGWIAETGKEVIIEDVSRDSRFNSNMDQLTDFTTESIIGVPLTSKDRVFGVIELINKLDGTPFTAFDLTLLKTIADFAAIAIEKAYYVQALKRVASIDALSGLYNRRAFQRFLEREVERAKRTGANLAVMMIDVDEFKAINDTYGHAAGDEVLKEVAELLQQSLRKVDLICRYGGDEFIVIMPDVAREGAEHARDRILAGLKERNEEAGIRFEVSIGLHESNGTNEEEIIRFVDQDLYDNKTRGVERTIDRVDQHVDEFVTEEE
jgi:diguanylate cyclase (GGDEF)-like protein